MVVKALKVAQSLLIVVMLGVAFAAAGLALGAAQSWWKIDVVLSGSMAPTMPTGSLVFATIKPTRDLAVGDVLMFNAPSAGSPKIMHRIVKIGHDKDGTLTVRTKGDNNNGVDFWTARVEAPESMVVNHHVPLVGYLVHDPTYVALLTAGLILLLMALGVLQSAFESDEEEDEQVDSGAVSDVNSTTPSTHQPSPAPVRSN